MDESELRKGAWDNAAHAEGTRAVFERRAGSLGRKTRLRDFVSIAVPILLAYLLGSEVFEPLKPYRGFAVGLVGIGALLQALLAAWSLMARWDEKLAEYATATRENYLLKEAWRKLGAGHAKDLGLEYELLSQREAMAAVRDSAAGITAKEKQFGMRSALIEFNRTCVCGKRPASREVPWRPQKECTTCGGN